MENDQERFSTEGLMIDANMLLSNIELFGDIVCENEDGPERAPMLYAIERVRSMIFETAALAWRKKYEQSFDLPGGMHK